MVRPLRAPPGIDREATTTMLGRAACGDITRVCRTAGARVRVGWFPGRATGSGRAAGRSGRRGTDGRGKMVTGCPQPHVRGVVMGQSFSLGRIFGIRVGVNWSVLVIVALLAYGLAVGEFPAAAPRHPVAEYVAAAVVTAVAYMGSLLAHELAHSLVARRNGLQVEGITLWLLGGVSRLQGEVSDPGAEVRIAGVGPLVSLLLGGGFLLLAWLVHAAGVRGVVVVALAWLGGINVLLAVFNVIPAAPLDGGRLLRAVLWRITGDKLKAAVWSARSGQVFGWALVVVSAYLVLVRREYNWLWFALLGWFLISAATAESQQAMLQSRLRTVAVR